MREKLDSDQGKAIYGRRKHIVEPVFGQIKSVMGFTSFLFPNSKGGSRCTETRKK